MGESDHYLLCGVQGMSSFVLLLLADWMVTDCLMQCAHPVGGAKLGWRT